MTDFSTIYRVCLLTVVCVIQASAHGSCPVFECWFMKEKVGGGLSGSANQEKSLLYVHRGSDGRSADSHDAPPEIKAERVYFFTDPAATLCHKALNPPRGSVQKPMCEISPFHPQPSSISVAAPLTESSLSPIYLQADWLSTSVQSFDNELSLAAIARAPGGAQEHNVVLTVSTKSVSVRSRLGAPVLLDCSFWADPSSPLSSSGFAVEWRYQFRGHGRLVLAYDGKSDRLSELSEDGATLDFEGLHKRGNASLILQEAKVQHSGLYICSVHLPYLLAQVTVDFEVIEPPSLSIRPSSPSPIAPGQTLSIQCEASGFAPLSLDLHWEFKGADGLTKSLGSGGLTSHRQSWDGTFSQSSRLELNTSELGQGGQLACVALHPAGTQRASVSISVIGLSSPSMEDSMAMVGVALVLYGLIKLVSWSMSSSGSDEASQQDKKDK